MGVIAVAGMFLGAFSLFATRSSQRRWSPAMAFLAFALLLAGAGCSGNASSSGSGSGSGGTGNAGGTPAGSTAAAVSVTNTASNAVVSVDFTVLVN
jgi:hypothetical protein